MEILDLTPVTYRYDQTKLNAQLEGTSDIEYGLIAEDVQDAGLEYLLKYDKNGQVESLDYSKLAVSLIPIIKQLKNDIDDLKKQLGANK
jgi:hypothetical protein